MADLSSISPSDSPIGTGSVGSDRDWWHVKNESVDGYQQQTARAGLGVGGHHRRNIVAGGLAFGGRGEDRTACTVSGGKIDNSRDRGRICWPSTIELENGEPARSPLVQYTACVGIGHVTNKEPSPAISRR